MTEVYTGCSGRPDGKVWERITNCFKNLMIPTDCLEYIQGRQIKCDTILGG